MDEDIKVLSNQLVKKIDRKIKSVIKKDPFKLSKTVDIGADGTPTKYIDKIAEDVALKAIKKSKISINLLSEEAGFIDNGGDYLIVLDPVDGTRNATRGIPFYSVSLAIGKSTLSDIEFGIVKNIPTGDEFIVEKNHGAFLNKNPVVIPDMPAAEPLLAMSLGKQKDIASKSLSKQYKIRSLGATSLEMCMVATGSFDSYVVERETMRVTDIAASTLFVREAGGIVANKFGKNLEMELSLDDRVSMIVAGNQKFIQTISNSLMER